MTIIRPVAGFFTAVCTGIAQNYWGNPTPAPAIPAVPLGPLKETGG